ncbi:hypothetical protein SAMN05216406_1871 [Nitrosomonas ureae]|uniref:Uncharacterized protein n=2 Tax=Nitrosomonas ureae TaxID=44577 RepID=A0A1H2I1A9_9PROT|nr:hypothetical protein SAMN05216406_1871 [Nitrosomonas ureae]
MSKDNAAENKNLFVFYDVKQSTGEKGKRYAIGYQEEEWPKGYIRHTYPIPIFLRSLINVKWLSVHRGSVINNSRENKLESSVDRKLIELSNRLVRYFSSIGKQGTQLLGSVDISHR